MKRRMTLSLVLTLSVVLISLTISDSTVQAEPPQRFRADTGLIIPGPHQRLRLTITGFGEDLLRVQFRQITYSQDVCNGGVCKHIIVSNDTSAPITLTPGEAASMDMYGTAPGGSVRGVVLSNGPNVRVNAMIINSITGEFTAIIDTGVNSGFGLQ